MRRVLLDVVLTLRLPTSLHSDARMKFTTKVVKASWCLNAKAKRVPQEMGSRSYEVPNDRREAERMAL